ncbi:MAG TPA: VOC family protein, partial [Nocardioidaceae bacterium]
MRLDHLSFAVGADGLDGTTERLSTLLGEEFVDGGVHPRFGTRNRVLPLTHGQFLEVVEVLDHPASDKAPFGQAVRARSEAGGGWLGWVVAVDDLAPVEKRLEREAVPGNRHRPDGIELRWKQIGVKGLQSDPQLPFFVQWESPAAEHPSVGASGEVGLERVEIAGDPRRVSSWL